jgi:molybdopterin adenylyltransferase
MTLRIGILTVSDRSARGERPDTSGPALEELVTAQGWKVSQRAIIADEPVDLRQTLSTWANGGNVDVILTTGGTGFAPRDVTPEATRQVIDREAPGLAEAMRSASLKVTPHGMLSRAVAGMRGKVLILNLPGNPKAAVENLLVVLPVLPHAVELLHDDPKAEQHH